MRTLEEWLSLYGESHRNKTNIIIHKICVPAIMFSLLGLMWNIPVPAWLKVYQTINWATLFIGICFIFYISLKNLKFILGVTLLIMPMLLILFKWDSFTNLPLLQTSLIIFVVAWIGQFIGHKIEGKKPSFLQDLCFLLIGPLWVIQSVYQSLGLVKKIN